MLGEGAKNTQKFGMGWLIALPLLAVAQDVLYQPNLVVEVTLPPSAAVGCAHPFPQMFYPEENEAVSLRYCLCLPDDGGDAVVIAVDESMDDSFCTDDGARLAIGARRARRGKGKGAKAMGMGDGDAGSRGKDGSRAGTEAMLQERWAAEDGVVVLDRDAVAVEKVAAGREQRRAVEEAGPRSALILRVTYNGQSPDYCDANCIRQNMWDGSPSVDSLYRETSYGAVKFPQSMGRVLDVEVTTGDHATSGCRFWEIGLEVDQAVAMMGVDASQYQHRSYYLPQGLGGCTFGGLGYVGCSAKYCKTWVRQSKGGTLAHELGHNLGVWHSGLDSDNDGVQDSEYGDNSDVMGSNTNWRGMNAVHRSVMGWIPASGRRTMDPAALGCDGSAQLRLASLSLEPLGDRGVSVLQLPRADAIGGGTYYVSLRGAQGVDAGMLSQFKDLVYVHYHTEHSTSSQVNSQLVAMLGSGDVFADEASTVRLQVMAIAEDATTADVHVGFCGADVEPLVREPASTTTAATTTTAAPSTEMEACADQSPDCGTWAELGYCTSGSFQRYMHSNCRAACRFCKTAKDGWAVGAEEDDEASQDRTMCLSLQPYQPKPVCNLDELSSCCPGLVCMLVGRNRVSRCTVPDRDRKREPGELCAHNRQCVHKCDRETWTCLNSDGSAVEAPPAAATLGRARREAAEDAANVAAAPKVSGPSDGLGMMVLIIGAAVTVCAVGLAAVRRRSTAAPAPSVAAKPEPPKLGRRRTGNALLAGPDAPLLRKRSSFFTKIGNQV